MIFPSSILTSLPPVSHLKHNDDNCDDDDVWEVVMIDVRHEHAAGGETTNHGSTKRKMELGMTLTCCDWCLRLNGHKSKSGT